MKLINMKLEDDLIKALDEVIKADPAITNRTAWIRVKILNDYKKLLKTKES